MKVELTCRIVLQKAPIGVVFGIQKGSGSQYETIQKQIADANDLVFEFDILVKNMNELMPDFAGLFVQGKPNERFIYIDIGSSAGQSASCWNRRLKIPLKNISIELLNKVFRDSSKLLEIKIPGTGKDGGPNCGTVKPFAGWHLAAK